MSAARQLFLPAGLALALPLAGCVTSASHHVWSLKSDVERELPGAALEPETTFHLGRISLSLTRGILGMVDDAEEGLEMLRQLRRVDVGIYRFVRGPETLPSEVPGRVESLLEGRGWTPVLKQREAGEMTWVYYLSDGSAIQGLYVVFLDDEELGIVRLKGRLDRALAVAIETAQRRGQPLLGG